ncbi:small multi-drug export protein [Candidatus Saccharibacteria bacterium]|nr:small multi-drug export protein [Candidatus Saccharibacteria bacterium]
MFWQILIVLIISMIPIIELRGAIPFAMWLGLNLPEWLILIVAIIGNIIPVPFIYYFAPKFLTWGAKKKWKPFRKLCEFCLKKGEKAGAKLLQKAGNYGTFVALFLFVAIPLPGTGAWTGTLAASILKLDFKKASIAIIAGIITAGLILLAASLGLFRGLLGI